MLGWDWSSCSEEDATRDRPSEDEFAETPLVEGKHVGRCVICGEPVAKGREEVHEGDVFHRYLDVSGRCEA